MAPANVLTRPGRTIGLGLTAFGLATSAGIAPAPILESDIVYDRSTGAWFQDSPALDGNIFYSRVQTPEIPPPAAPTAIPASTAESVRGLREETGLTWDQMARLFGVSRRAVHHWASGGRMNSVNEKHLSDIWTAVRQLPAHDPGERRTLLISTPTDGPSIFEQLKAGQPTSEILQTAAYSPDQLVGGVGN